MVDNLIRTGYSPSKIWRKVRSWCEAHPEPTEPFDAKQLDRIVDVPHVIGRWHSDPNYLDEQGNPVRLPGKSGAKSLASLIRAVLPAEDPIAITQSLLEKGWIKRESSGYLPTARHCIYSPQDLSWHTLAVTSGVMRTIAHNRQSPEYEKLLERVATNPNIPVAALPRLYNRIRSEATAMLQNADTDFQGFERMSEQGPRTRIGVGIYVFRAPSHDAEASARPVSGHVGSGAQSARARRTR